MWYKTKYQWVSCASTLCTVCAWAGEQTFGCGFVGRFINRFKLVFKDILSSQKFASLKIPGMLKNVFFFSSAGTVKKAALFFAQCSCSARYSFDFQVLARCVVLKHLLINVDNMDVIKFLVIEQESESEIAFDSFAPSPLSDSHFIQKWQDPATWA